MVVRVAGSLSKLCERMRYWCEEANLGYDQGNRWDIRVGGECDCSSLTYWCLWEAGFLTKPSGSLYAHTLYTGSIRGHLVAAGWKTLKPDLSQAKPGDVLLSEQHHVCVVVEGSGWGAKVAQASIDERGRASGGAAGDQTGGETNVRAIYTYSRGWDCILRYQGGDAGDAPTPSTGGRLDVDGWLGYLSVWAWQEALGTPADGVVSGQVASNRQHWPRLVSVTCEDGGSPLVRAVQAKVGAGVDGHLGPLTVQAIQMWLNREAGCTLLVDGILGAQTAKWIQAAINASVWS